MVWVPRYIKQTIAKRPGQIVSSEDWNDLFNLLIGQGDYTAEGLLSVITTFTNNLTTKADLVSGKIPLEQIPEIFKPTGLEALITTVGSLGTTVDGLVPTVNNLVAAVDGIEDYVLPTASTTVKGGIKVDGTSIVVDGNGVASAIESGGGLTEADVFAICKAGVTTLGHQIDKISWYMSRAYIPSSVISMGDNWFYAAILTYEINGGEHLTTVGNNFAASCTALTTISLPALTTVGSSFVYSCTALTTISLPALTTVGNNFAINSTALTTISLPALTTVGQQFAYNCPLTHLVVGGANTLTLTSTSNNSYTTWKLPVGDMVAFGTALKWATSATAITFSATYWNALSAAQKSIFTNKNYTVTTQ